MLHLEIGLSSDDRNLTGDEALRALERRVAAGDETVRLAWARALERAGKRDEAWAALLAGDRDDAAIRAELARLPAWRFVRGDRGGTRYLDVPPVLTLPRPLWEAPIGGSDVRWLSDLLVSPLGAVAIGAPGLVALDPDTGERRFADPAALGALLLGDAVLTLGGPPAALRASLRDLRTGEVLLEGGVSERPVGLDELLSLSTSPELPPLAITDPSRGPLRIGPCPAVGRDAIATVLTDSYVAALRAGPPQVIEVIDRITGAVRWRAAMPGGRTLLGNERGLAAVRSGATAVALDATTGHELAEVTGTGSSSHLPVWMRNQQAIPLALSPERLLIGRQRGRPRGLEPVVRLLDSGGALTLPLRCHDMAAFARDVLYVGDFRDGLVELVALRPGEPALWRLPVSWASSPVVYPGRIYGMTRARPAGGLVVCLAPPD